MSDEPALPGFTPPSPASSPPANAGPGFPVQAMGDQVVDRFLAMVSSGSMHPQDSFLDKLTSPQIDKLFDQASESEKRAQETRSQAMRLGFYIVIATLLFLVLVLFLFLNYGKGDLLREIMALIIGAVGGGAVGGVIGRATKSESSRI